MFSLQGDSSASDRNFYGSGLQNPRLGWGKLYTPSPQSPDSAPAPLQRNYQFHQGAYMYNNQQMTALHDRCKALETQVIKLTTERDTLQTHLTDDGNWMTLKTNGTIEEFCAHYGDLTPTQRKAYDDESASLVSYIAR
ncbi:hypothetical protein F4604DRAFT_1686156 [Suillus subluteus]|nr:hypothetical protein F4604DRAFT_1686156 [Suillus subluteus]